MERSDFLVVALALTKDTRHFINADSFAHAKDGQVFINVGRGAVVDEEALIEALGNGGRLTGAALDVFTVEPLPKESPFWSLDNVLISPHNADQTFDFKHRSVRFFTENCKRFLNGEELLNRVDWKAGY